MTFVTVNQDVNVDVDVDSDEILAALPMQDIVDYYGMEDLLETIGIDKCMEYFNLGRPDIDEI